MKIVTVGTLKGGTGKTTMTFNMAGALAKEKRVLLIDMDPQCNLSNNVGIDVTDPDVYSAWDIFETQGVKPSNLVVYQPIPTVPNLDIIPGNIRMIATEAHINNRAARERILKNYIEDNTDFFEQYDIIMIDTHPSMGTLEQNAFLAADSIILVTDVDDNSRIGIQLFTALWEEIRHDLRVEDNVKALIVNRASATTTLTSDILEYCRENEELSGLLVDQIVRAKVIYTRAAMARVPVTDYRGGKKAEREEACNEIYRVVEILTERGVF